ncbi:MAG: hydrogenase, partial [Methanobacteriales archaeon]|nr:hydrogenase [Methanobacteriales archaeon]
MKSLIALMVILPILCGLLLNLLHKKDRTIKILALTVAIILPIIPLIASYGAYYFGGYPPIAENPTIAEYLPAYITGSYLVKFHPAITYIFNSAQRIFIFILGIVAFLAIFTSLNEVKKPSGVYSFLMFMATAAVTAIVLADDIFNLYVFFEIAAISQAGIILSSNIKGSYKMALRYLFLGGVAAPMLLLGVALLLGAIGNVNISDMI